MVKGLMPKKVTKQVGMNPIARAVARANLRKAILDQKIQLYMLPEGAECAEICEAMAVIFKALIAAAEADKDLDIESREVRVLKGGLSACEQMITHNSFRRINIVSLEQSLDCAAEINSRVKPELFNRAWNMLSGGA